MQWAIRNRESSTRTAGLRVTGGSNLVFIDPVSLRRTTATSAVAAAQEPITMGTTASCLARAFGIVIRQIADLLVMMQDYKTLAPTLPRLMEITFQDALNLQVCLILLLSRLFFSIRVSFDCEAKYVSFFFFFFLFFVFAVIFRSTFETNVGLAFNSYGCYRGTVKVWGVFDA